MKQLLSAVFAVVIFAAYYTFDSHYSTDSNNGLHSSPLPVGKTVRLSAFEGKGDKLFFVLEKNHCIRKADFDVHRVEKNGEINLTLVETNSNTCEKSATPTLLTYKRSELGLSKSSHLNLMNELVAGVKINTPKFQAPAI